MADKSFQENLIKQATETAWRSYGQFVNEFDAAVDNIHSSNMKFINLNFNNGPINPRLADQTSEHTDYVELLQTCGNMDLNKVIMVFATLCSEMNHLSQVGLEEFVDPLSMYGQGRGGHDGETNPDHDDDLKDMSKFLIVLYDLLCYANRCLSVARNLIQQLEALFTVYKKTKAQPNKSSIEVVNIKFDMVFDYFGKLIVTLVNIDEVLASQQVIRRDFVNYKRIVELTSKDVTKFGIDEAETQRVKTLFGVIKVVEKELIDGGTLLNRLIDSVTTATTPSEGSNPSLKNSQLCDQFLNYIRQSIVDFEADSFKATDGRRWLSVNCLFLVYIWLFRKDDKKLFKTLLDSERKTGILQVHLRGNVTVLPEKLLCTHLPKSMADKKTLDLIATQRETMMKQSLDRELKQTMSKLTSWVVSFEVSIIVNQDTTSNLVGNLMKQMKAVEDGFELALSTAQLVRNFVFLHLHYGKSIGRSDVASICKLIAILKAIEITFERKKGTLLLIISTFAQYNSCLALNSLSGMKKRLLADVTKYSEKKLDIISAVILASNCFHGPILTEARQVITALCLAFVVNSMNDSEAPKIVPAFRKVEQTSRFIALLKDNTSCEFFYFNRNVLGTFFNYVHEHELGNVRDMRYFFLALDDCEKLIRRGTEIYPERQKIVLKQFEDDVWQLFTTEYLERLCTDFETELRLQTHLDLKLDDQSPFKRRMHDFTTPFSSEPFRILSRFVSVRNHVENYLSEMAYNLTTIALHDWKTYESMLNLAKTKYGLTFVTSQLPTQTLEQGLDVLEITRNIHIFVSRYLYNLNNQMFIEKSSENKHLNVLLIRHVANSIQTHGFGIINTAVNFTYQFLTKKFSIFSQFLYEEHIKSRLLKDLRHFRESKSTKFPYDRADKLVKGIRKLGLTPDGLSFLDQFRVLISEIGNALGFVRMLRSGALRCSSVSVNYVPDLDDLSDGVSFEAMAKDDGLAGESLEAAKNLDTVLSTLNRNFGEATDFFKLLVDVFSSTFRDQKNYHLRNFYVILPALTVNYVEYSVMSKEKMNRKNKVGAAFTDDGFAMGVAYVLCLLDQYSDFEAFQWFASVREKITVERNEAIKQKNSVAISADEKLTQTTSLTLKRLEVLQKEFDLLNFNLTSCKILFKAT